MQSISVKTAQNVNISYEAASIGDRIIAFLIDAIIRFTYLMGVTTMLNQLGIEVPMTVNLVIMSPALIYYLWMEIFFNGQSLGKMALNMKVVMLDGSRPTLGAYLLRWVLRILDITLFTGGIAVITILINGKGQRLGDVAANTTVVKLQKQISVKRHELLKKMPESYKPTFEQCSQLSDADIAVILEALSIFKKTGNRNPVMAAEKKVKELLDIKAEMPSVQFLYTIVRDYNYLTSGLE